MANTSGETLAIWPATAEVPTGSTLTENITAEVCIVGAGIAGMTIAYLLAREGKSVAVMEPIDGVAFIGRNPLDPKNVYIVTGDSGMGMTHGTIAGMLITDLIVGRKNPWKELYDPSRKSLLALGRYMQENINVAALFVGDYLSGGDVAAVDEIAPDEGAVIRRGLKKVAVYRDGQGRSPNVRPCAPISAASSTGTAWRRPGTVRANGQVINGPANRNLAQAEE